MFRYGIAELVLVRDPGEALAFRDRHPGGLAAGEVKGEKVDGFDLEHLLSGTPYDHLAAVWDCLNDPSIARSLRGEHSYRPREDVILALQRDAFDFVMVGRLVDGHVRVMRVDT